MPDVKPVHCLITAGPTREYFDPVRFISNPSSGKMGYALAAAALERGWQVTLVSGPVAIEPPPGVTLLKVTSGQEMFEAVEANFPCADILIMAAAVCDMRPKCFNPGKVKKDKLQMTVEFVPVVDILKTIAAKKCSGQTVVGFAAETENVLEHARAKLISKSCDYIVANQVGHSASAFESDHNQITLLGADGSTLVAGPDTKASIAAAILSGIKLMGAWLPPC